MCSTSMALSFDKNENPKNRVRENQTSRANLAKCAALFAVTIRQSYKVRASPSTLPKAQPPRWVATQIVPTSIMPLWSDDIHLAESHDGESDLRGNTEKITETKTFSRACGDRLCWTLRVRAEVLVRSYAIAVQGNVASHRRKQCPYEATTSTWLKALVVRSEPRRTQ
jgi:hypothetical protein